MLSVRFPTPRGFSLGVAALTVLVAVSACGGSASSGDWRLTKSLFEGKHSLAVAALHGSIFAVGGHGQKGVLQALDIYDPISKVWDRGEFPPVALSNHAVAAHKGTLYMTGGKGAGTAAEGVGVVTRRRMDTWSYDPAGSVWSRLRDMPGVRLDHGMASVGDYIYVFAGEDARGPVAETWVYDPAVDAWSTGADIPTPRAKAAWVVYDGRIYVFGGRDKKSLASVEVYDPAADTWQQLPDLPWPRQGFAAVLIGSSVHLLGGSDPETMSRHDVLDLESGTWSVLPGLSPGRVIWARPP